MAGSRTENGTTLLAVAEVLQRLEDVAARLESIGGDVPPPGPTATATLASDEDGRQFYTTKEAAVLLGKAEFTVREYARLGRCKAVRAKSGRGTDCEWRYPKSEILRIKEEGLLPPRTYRSRGGPRS